MFEQEFFPELCQEDEEPYTVVFDEEDEVYVVEGPSIEKMLGYTNIDSEKGFYILPEILKTAGNFKGIGKIRN